MEEKELLKIAKRYYKTIKNRKNLELVNVVIPADGFEETEFIGETSYKDAKFKIFASSKDKVGEGICSYKYKVPEGTPEIVFGDLYALSTTGKSVELKDIEIKENTYYVKNAFIGKNI